MSFLVFLLFIFFLLIRYKEMFTPNEIKKKYIEIDNKFCLVTKKIGAKGGYYKSKVMTGNLPKLFDNQKAILLNTNFTEKDCINKNFGSGRQKGGFVCVDFITKQNAEKYNLVYSNKTCFDNLNFTPNYPNYLKKVSIE